MAGRALGVDNIKQIGTWIGALYSIPGPAYALKVKGFEAVVISREQLTRLLTQETPIEKNLRETGR